MEKSYQPSAIESKWYTQWEKLGAFKPSGKGKHYCIMIPPPNVTGSLHMGHGFQHTLMDILIRYHRMQGDTTLWQMGTDHAGISTQMVVEKQCLNQEQKTRHDYGREAFVEKIWQWKEVSGNRICEQIRRMGSSVDWSRERFTLDDNLSQVVLKVFIELYQEGLIYRGKKLVNWDPVLHTAISDLEVVSEEEDGHMWHLRYPLANGVDHLIVATTRPETMLGDAAVAVHPDDARYQKFIGQEIILPLTDRRIPIIADDYVDPTFGSGCVKITPAHDFNDYAVGQRHQLEKINIFTIEAKINDNAPQAYRDLDRRVAREKIVADFQALGLLERVEPYKLTIPRGEKSGAIIEPYLTDQWFVKVAPLAKPAIEAVESGEIRFIPENWQNTYFQWMHNIEDWCISRQLWWGHRIPAWYDADNNIYVGSSENDVRQKYKLGKQIQLRQDEDVLDTWFSSALWPFATLGWPAATPEFKQFYPTQVLMTGFDIIFFWVARMIMMSLKFTGKIPFKEIYITGLIRDSEGQKMSKSKGNTLDPLDLIDGISVADLIKKRTENLLLAKQRAKITKATQQEFPDGIPAFGTDALRFTYCALASTGRNIRFSMGRIDGYANFCNKLWNAARYVLMATEQSNTDLGDGPHEYSLTDRWIISRLQRTILQSQKYYQNYRFDLLANTLYDFVWHEYCDWYLEFSKTVLYNEDASKALKRGAQHALLTVLETILRLLHPIIPFITEEIWQLISKHVGVSGPTIMLQAYPIYDENLLADRCETDIEWIKAVIISIRNIRGEMQISPSKPLEVYCDKGKPSDKERLCKHKPLLLKLGKLAKITWLKPGDKPPASATALVNEMEILIPIADVVDLDAEAGRLQKEIDKLTKVLQIAQGKLENVDFIERAPASVVAKEQEKVKSCELTLEQLRNKLGQILLL